MIRKLAAAIFVIMGLLIACSTSSSEKAEQPVIKQNSDSKIAWEKFDDALKSVSNTDKHVLAYFWRDG